MKKIMLEMKLINKYKDYLYGEEKSQATIEKYIRDIKFLYNYLLDDTLLTKEVLVSYKRFLIEQNYKLTSINSMLVAINGLLEFLDLDMLKLKLYKVQKKVFYEEYRELTKQEYKRLLEVAMRKDNQRLYMLLQTICGTGIRVSEHKYITVESLKDEKVIVRNKGKARIIFIPKQLKKLLENYCKEKNIVSGSIFITKKGKPMDRSNIWNQMKKLCSEARVDERKVFPHNLRHLFALTYYRLEKDIVRLADILGHSSIETTRIYTMTSGKECQKSLSRMDLVSILT